MIAGIPSHQGTKVRLNAEHGFIGANTLYLGDYTVHKATVGCQEFEVIEPEATLLLDADKRLQELRTASRATPVGHKYTTVRIFVSPKSLGDVGGFVYRNNRLENNEIVVTTRTPGSASELWIHEYIHTLQGFRQQPSLTWFNEASATYLANRIALEHGFIHPRYYDQSMASRNYSKPLVRAVSEEVAYSRGMAVLARLDQSLAAKGDGSVIELFRVLNRDRNPGLQDVRSYLKNEGSLGQSEVKTFNENVLHNKSLEIPYLLGPAWLPSEARVVIGAVSTAPFRWFCGIVGVVALGSEVNNRMDETEQDGD
jgi:hypothetical protein